MVLIVWFSNTFKSEETASVDINNVNTTVNTVQENPTMESGPEIVHSNDEEKLRISDDVFSTVPLDSDQDTMEIDLDHHSSDHSTTDGKVGESENDESNHINGKAHLLPYSMEKFRGQLWYEFDDTRVTQIKTEDIAAQYGGSACACILFPLLLSSLL